jgi:hypothetical protein
MICTFLIFIKIKLLEYVLIVVLRCGYKIIHEENIKITAKWLKVRKNDMKREKRQKMKKQIFIINLLNVRIGFCDQSELIIVERENVYTKKIKTNQHIWISLN